MTRRCIVSAAAEIKKGDGMKSFWENFWVGVCHASIFLALLVGAITLWMYLR